MHHNTRVLISGIISVTTDMRTLINNIDYMSLFG